MRVERGGGRSTHAGGSARLGTVEPHRFSAELTAGLHRANLAAVDAALKDLRVVILNPLEKIGRLLFL